MSQRGSFVTEYLYCKTCFNAAWKALSDLGAHDKYLMATRVPAWGEDGVVSIMGEASTVLPIIAGKIGSTGSEQADFEHEVLPVIAGALCRGHSARVALLPEGRAAWVYVCSRDPEDDTHIETLVGTP